MGSKSVGWKVDSFCYASWVGQFLVEVRIESDKTNLFHDGNPISESFVTKPLWTSL